MGQPANWEREDYYLNRGQRTIVGMDEVGRGSWAGPLVAATFCFRTKRPPGLAVYDSKQLSSTRRQKTAATLYQCGCFGLGVVTASEIDAIGLQPAQYLAYNRALENLHLTPDIVLLDGRTWRECPYPIESIIKGDSLVASIGAASILAKVYRDNLMQTTIHEQYPSYGFNTHVGYGTLLHKKALDRFGPCQEHRKSFRPIQAWLQ